ncbi:ImmA/IrrE family metallo-endopeptidase [Castellaniella sp.]|uniref:ImmA/IrrE family metallo-endopeptidase n=1 Tax=Castellaniella sp. TaxID=1955812 RepID=UPI002AFF1DE8|nr:ImmA/IrrE family metallo-endopeptidase [Castellaniella sp.]
MPSGTRNSGTTFFKAFLVGHELGHATLGDDRVERVAHDVDPTRPAEAAPVGEDRVVDYSRRQRREVQMDLFGRELLLPRKRARALHLDGMTASEIATRLGPPSTSSRYSFSMRCCFRRSSRTPTRPR